MNDVIARLVSAGMLQSVPADVASAKRWLEDAERHLKAAAQIADVDRSGSYALLYDASRKAIAAILLAAGFRMMAAPGAHAALAEAATSLTTVEDELSYLRQIDRMRRQRNRSEYGVRSFSTAELGRAAEVARWIVDFANARVT